MSDSKPTRNIKKKGIKTLKSSMFKYVKEKIIKKTPPIKGTCLEEKKIWCLSPLEFKIQFLYYKKKLIIIIATTEDKKIKIIFIYF